jgi:hypothetical protein
METYIQRQPDDDITIGFYIGKTKQGFYCVIIVREGGFWAYEIMSKLPVEKEDITHIMELPR